MMLTIALIVAVLAAISLVITLANVLTWPRVEPAGEPADGRVSLLIPARNEEANIAACLDAALAQELHEIIVCNDHSSDGTARILAGYGDRIRVIEPGVLPPGWSGKCFACDALGRHAEGDWLLFLDADARLQPGAVRRILAQAQELDVTFLSCWPQLEMRGLAERLVMPLLNFVVFTLFPAPLQFRRRDPSLGLAHGACIMMRRQEYLAIGGHESVKNELFEDTRLARVWRERGFRGACLDGTGTVRVRMYDSLRAVFNGFQKIVFPAFDGHAGFWTFWVLHATVFWSPFLFCWTAFRGEPAGLLFAAAAGCVLLARLALAFRFAHPIWSALLHPVGQAVLLAAGLSSWARVTWGHGLGWKGRYYYATSASGEDQL